MLAAALSIGGTVSGAEPANDLVAEVDLEFIRETDDVAAVMCMGDSDDDCFPWAHHYLWRARIRRILGGEETQRTFLVLYGRHALSKKDLPRRIVVMKRLEDDSPAQARYQIKDMAYEVKLTCFRESTVQDSALEMNYKVDRGEFADPLRCFDPDELAG